MPFMKTVCNCDVSVVTLSMFLYEWVPLYSLCMCLFYGVPKVIVVYQNFSRIVQLWEWWGGTWPFIAITVPVESAYVWGLSAI